VKKALLMQCLLLHSVTPLPLLLLAATAAGALWWLQP